MVDASRARPWLLLMASALSGCGYIGIDLLGLHGIGNNPPDSGDASTPLSDAGPEDAGADTGPMSQGDAALDAMAGAGGSDSGMGSGGKLDGGDLEAGVGSTMDAGSDAAMSTMDSGSDAAACDGMCEPVDSGPVSACDTTPLAFSPGAYTDIAVPAGCTQVTVELWGGGGASGGKTVAWSSGSGGRGGAGGYATSTLAISGALTLFVGSGGAAGCADGGTIPDTSLPLASKYAGGAAGTGNGSNGADGVVAGGGNGGNSSSGGDGGRGYYGGGGGGHGSSLPVPATPAGGGGGGGGAASALLMDGVLSVVAGGGGGSGGELGAWYGADEFSTGGSGGEGCSGAGQPGAGAQSGAGGGGGVCLGMLTQPGVEGVPYSSGSLPEGQALGATDTCAAGGGGYAILTFGA